MSDVIKPPTKLSWLGERPSVFLAGTIDDGNSVDWQSNVEDILKDKDILILNPRRDDWDSSLEQSIDNPEFMEQVTWELNGLTNTDIILMYFAPGSISPITLLELGLHVHNDPVIVCPEGFWRKGNVDIVASLHGVPVYNNLEDGLSALLERCELLL